MSARLEWSPLATWKTVDVISSVATKVMARARDGGGVLTFEHDHEWLMGFVAGCPEAEPLLEALRDHVEIAMRIVP